MARKKGWTAGSWYVLKTVDMQHGGITWRSRQCPMVILRCGDLRFLQYWNVCTASERIRARSMILSRGSCSGSIWLLHAHIHIVTLTSDQFPVAWTLVHYIVVVLHRSPYKHLSSAIARHSRVELAGFNGVPTGSNNYSFDWHFFRANFYLLQTVSQKKNTRAGKLSDRIRAQTMTSSWVLLWLRLIPQKQISCGMDSRTPQWCCVVQESIPWFTCNKSKANQFQSYTGLAGWMITSSSWCRGFGGPLVRVNIPKSLRLWLWLWLTD